jgi:hypothetical protein
MQSRCRWTLVASAVLIAACSAWAPIELEGPTPAQMPERARVTVESGELITLDRPFLEGDSIIAGFGDDLELLRIPLAQVVSVEAGERMGVGRSVLQVLGGVGLAAAVLVVLGMSGGF